MRLSKSGYAHWMVLSLLMSPAPALAIPCNTGVAGSASTCSATLLTAGSADAHWGVLAPFPTALSTDPLVAPPFVGTFSSAFVNNLSGAWLSTGPDSDWITPSQLPGSELGGQYVYRTTFVGDTPFSGQFAADNQLWAVYLDGVQLGGFPPIGPSQFNFWTAFGPINPGGGPTDPHTLDFVIRNGGAGGLDANPTAMGFRAEFVAAPSTGVVIDWVTIGNPGNAADTPSSNCNLGGSCGSVPHSYMISKYEVTNTQYAEFLNSVDAGGTNPLALYSASMDSSGGISFIPGNAPGSKYVVKVGFGNKPVVFVTLFDSLRFANWLTNGQGAGDTETGAYTLLGGTATPSNGLTVTRNGGALIFLPSENEWYKAAYFNAATTSYFDYPAGSDSPTVCSVPTPTANRANCSTAGVAGVGVYTGSASPYGTFDQGGNVREWKDDYIGSNDRNVRGGSYFLTNASLAASFPLDPVFPTLDNGNIGFRVVRVLVTPPAAPIGDIVWLVVPALFMMTGLLAVRRRRSV
jgi:sulfatase modifying factor 1